MASVKKRRSPPEMKKMKNDDDQTDCTSGPAPSPDANDVSVCVTAVHSLKASIDQLTAAVTHLRSDVQVQAVQIRLLERQGKGMYEGCRPKVIYRLGTDNILRKYILCPETPEVCLYLRSDHMKSHLARDHYISEELYDLYKKGLPDYFGLRRTPPALAADIIRQDPHSAQIYSNGVVCFTPEVMGKVYYTHLTSFKGRFVIRDNGRQNETHKKHARTHRNTVVKILKYFVDSGALGNPFTTAELALVVYEWSLRGDAFSVLAAGCGWANLYLSSASKKLYQFKLFTVYLNTMFVKILDPKLLGFLSGTTEITRSLSSTLLKESELERTELKVNNKIKYPSLEDIKAFTDSEEHQAAMSFLEKAAWSANLSMITDESERKRLYKEIGQHLCTVLLLLTGTRPDCVAGLRVRYFKEKYAPYEFCRLAYSDAEVKAKIAVQLRDAVNTTEELTVIIVSFYMYEMLSRYAQMRLLIDPTADDNSFLFVTPVRLRRLASLAEYIREAWKVEGYDRVAPYHFRRGQATHIRAVCDNPVFRNFVACQMQHTLSVADKSYNLDLTNKTPPSKIKEHDVPFRKMKTHEVEVGRKVAALLSEYAVLKSAAYDRTLELEVGSQIMLVNNKLQKELMNVEQITKFFAVETSRAVSISQNVTNPEFRELRDNHNRGADLDASCPNGDESDDESSGTSDSDVESDGDENYDCNDSDDDPCDSDLDDYVIV